MERPEFVTDTILRYLDVLREGAHFHMDNTVGYLQRRFALSPAEAGRALSYWKATTKVLPRRNACLFGSRGRSE